MKGRGPALLAAAALALAPGCASVPSPVHESAALAKDARAVVEFPAPLREHTLANMRDHLNTLREIQAALAAGRFEQAGEIAERRLGLSSLEAHGAHEVAQYMPPGMQEAGSAMHRSASRFALAAQNASATHDVRGSLAALAEVTGHCVACHAAYRLK